MTTTNSFPSTKFHDMLDFIQPDAPQRVKLIFNPLSGSQGGSRHTLQVIVAALQAANMLPEVYLVEPEHDLRPVIKEALRRGHRLFVARGGDGTIDTVAGALAGTRGTLGIVPAGTRNNVAFSLGIPDDPAAAVGMLPATDDIQHGNLSRVGDFGCANRMRTTSRSPRKLRITVSNKKWPS